MHVHYRPADHVLDALSQVDFVAVVGSTASGKTTLIKTAMQREPSLHKVLNNTSRAPRSEEIDGVDFKFLTKEAMQERIQRGEYVQVAPTVLGELYATAPEDYRSDGVAVLEVLAAAIPVFRALPFKSMRTIYVLPPSWNEWQKRIQAHHFSPQQLQKRLLEARNSLQFALQDAQTQFVINETLSAATDDLVTLATGKSPSSTVQLDQARAPDIARKLLEKLG